MIGRPPGVDPIDLDPLSKEPRGPKTDRALRSDNRRRHDKPDDYQPPGPVRHLVADGQPTGISPSTPVEIGDVVLVPKRRIIITTAPAGEKSDEELRSLARAAAAHAIVNPPATEIESLRKIDLALGILAKLGEDERKPVEEMSVEELQAALKSR